MGCALAGWPPPAAFLSIAALAGGGAGLPLLLAVTAAVGLGLLAAAAVQLWRHGGGERSMDSARWRDAALAGLMQRLSVLPGLSRSWLTVAALLGRGFRAWDALALSFLMSAPAGLGGALLAGSLWRIWG